MRPSDASLKTEEIPHLAYPSTRDAPHAIDLADFSDSDSPIAVASSGYRDRFGAIRPGGPVRIFSREYCGLLVSGLMSSLVYQMLRDCLRYLHILLEFDPNSQAKAQRFVDSTAILAFFVGLMSDCVPLFGYNRKSYLLLGWAITCSVLLVMVIATQASHDYLSPYAFTGIAACCSFGTMITYVATEIRLVELSQRESLHARGFIVAIYTIFRITGQTLGRIISRLVLGASSWSSIRHGFVALFLFSLIAPVCVYKYLDEPFATRPRLPWREGFYNFRMLIQQRVVRYIVAFVCIFSAFSNVRMPDAERAIAQWVGVGEDGQYTARVGRDVVAIMAVCMWSGFLINKPWLSVFSIGPIFNSFPPVLLSLSVATNVYRAGWFYFFMSVISGVSDGIFRIAYLIPLVEICSMGSEGQTVGLVLSFDKLLATIARTASTEGFEAAKWLLTTQALASDSNDAHNRVAAISVGGNILRLLALLAFIFLPTQKQDAQQQRLYGTYRPQGGAVVVAVFVLSFVGVIALDINFYL